MKINLKEIEAYRNKFATDIIIHFNQGVDGWIIEANKEDGILIRDDNYLNYLTPIGISNIRWALDVLSKNGKKVKWSGTAFDVVP